MSDIEDLKEKITSLNPWFYNLKIGDIEVVPAVGSPHGVQELIERTVYTKKIFVDEILKRYNFKGKRVLDVGANCSYWTSFYADAGAVNVTAIEGRQQFIEQGLLHWSINKNLPMDQVNFVLGDVANEKTWENTRKFSPFDFCLCAGILYHTLNHDFVLNKIVSLNPEVIFVDTRVVKPNALYSTAHQEQGDWKFDAIKSNCVVKLPTLEYLMAFFDEKKYKVERIRIPDELPKDNTMQTGDNYTEDRRVSLYCVKI